MNLKLSEVTFNLIMLHNATLFNFCFTVTTSLARTALIKLQTFRHMWQCDRQNLCNKLTNFRNQPTTFDVSFQMKLWLCNNNSSFRNPEEKNSNKFFPSYKHKIQLLRFTFHPVKTKTYHIFISRKKQSSLLSIWFFGENLGGCLSYSLCSLIASAGVFFCSLPCSSEPDLQTWDAEK